MVSIQHTDFVVVVLLHVITRLQCSYSIEIIYCNDLVQLKLNVTNVITIFLHCNFLFVIHHVLSVLHTLHVVRVLRAFHFDPFCQWFQPMSSYGFRHG